ncbi:hypothetical protein ND748_31085, partial [Frankia sp. AiPs1]|nr:hypothetical protein [Frankia sp. AiPs1]
MRSRRCRRLTVPLIALLAAAAVALPLLGRGADGAADGDGATAASPTVGDPQAGGPAGRPGP